MSEHSGTSSRDSDAAVGNSSVILQMMFVDKPFHDSEVLDVQP